MEVLLRLDGMILNTLMLHMHPACVYCEYLTDESKLDDETVFQILKHYSNYCINSGPLQNSAEIYKDDDFRKMQNAWLTALADKMQDEEIVWKMHYIEHSDFTNLCAKGIAKFFEIFFAFLAEPDFLKYYRGYEPKSVREKSDLYLQYLMDVNLPRENAADSENEYCQESPFADKGFVAIIRKYWYQICLFAAVGIGNMDMFYALRDGYVDTKGDKESKSAGAANESKGVLRFPDSPIDAVPFV